MRSIAILSFCLLSLGSPRAIAAPLEDRVLDQLHERGFCPAIRGLGLFLHREAMPPQECPNALAERKAAEYYSWKIWSTCEDIEEKCRAALKDPALCRGFKPATKKKAAARTRMQENLVELIGAYRLQENWADPPPTPEAAAEFRSAPCRSAHELNLFYHQRLSAEITAMEGRSSFEITAVCGPEGKADRKLYLHQLGGESAPVDAKKAKKKKRGAAASYP